MSISSHVLTVSVDVCRPDLSPSPRQRTPIALLGSLDNQAPTTLSHLYSPSHTCFLLVACTGSLLSRACPVHRLFSSRVFLEFSYRQQLTNSKPALTETMAGENSRTPTNQLPTPEEFAQRRISKLYMLGFSKTPFKDPKPKQPPRRTSQPTFEELVCPPQFALKHLTDY
jgi:hypothetical protein